MKNHVCWRICDMMMSCVSICLNCSVCRFVHKWMIILEQCSVQNVCIILCWQLLCNGFKHFVLSILYWQKIVGLFFMKKEGGCILTPNIFIGFLQYLFHVILISGDYRVTIGDVTKEVKTARNPQFVPCKYCKYSLATW